jgi:CubicO group peptidase (beta-lactamase class C family)
LALQLAEEGRLTLDDPLHKWLPDFPNINNTAAVRQLLDHTGGISHFAEDSAYWQTVMGIFIVRLPANPSFPDMDWGRPSFRASSLEGRGHGGISVGAPDT